MMVDADVERLSAARRSCGDACPIRRIAFARLIRAQAKIGIIGLGYVGLPLAVEFARAGFDVTGFDVDASKISQINAGKSYIPDVPDADLAAQVSAKRLRATTDMAHLGAMDVIDICVPTPLRKTKDPGSLVRREGGGSRRGDAPPRPARDPRIDDLSGHDRRSRAADARSEGRQSGRRFPARVLARARRSGQPELQDARTFRRSSAASGRRALRPRPRALRRRGRHRSSR